MTREKVSSAVKQHSSSGCNSCPSYVHSRITVYHASKIDLRYCRSLHSCASCKLGQVEDPCGAIHFGICAAVAPPSAKVRRGSGAYSLTAPTTVTGSVKDGGIVYYRGVKISPPTSPGSLTSPKIRSLAILREGHELAGTPLDSRAAFHQSGLFRLRPQRQVVFQRPRFGIEGGGDTIKQQGGFVVVSPGSYAVPGQGGGMAITVSPGQTNINSKGNTDIEIKGQGHKIHIQSSGGQNIRFHPAVGPGSHGGHVIRIHGRNGQRHVQYLEHGGVTPVPLPLHVDVVDSVRGPLFPVPNNFSSTKQFFPQKPTARVAPAPVVSTAHVPSPTLTPAIVPSLPAPVFSPTPASPASVQSAPTLPVLSTNVSLPSTSAASSSQLTTAASVTTTVPPTRQPVQSVKNKDKDVGNYISLAASSLQKPTPDTINIRQASGVKDASDQLNVDNILFHQTNDVDGSKHKILGKNNETCLQPTQQDPRIPDKIHSITSDSKSSLSLSHVHIPRFYFPSGKPGKDSEIEVILHDVAQAFVGLEGGRAFKEHMGNITKACGLPVYWKILLFRAAGGASDGFVTYQSLSILLRKLYQSCHDEASKFMRLTAKPGANVLEFEDFEPFVQDVIETHTGLTFLQDAPEFHSRYITTVISRIMFSVNRSWTGKITLPELRKSNFLQTVIRLELEDDINQIKDYFSYEHFYVIYCKFWELDKDHDLFIDRHDLSQHNDHALSSRIIDRIFSGAVTRVAEFHEGRMSYSEFVWFLLAEVDKKHQTSIEYWFRCMDLDGDGVISMYEMEYFHEEQMAKMEALGIERLPFEDTVCQMMDMVNPKMKGKITLSDLKACKMTDIFFDTFFNLDKFLEHEQRDPFANARDPDTDLMEDSDWNTYAEEEYDNLVADEGSAELDNRNYEGSFENDDDNLLRDEMLMAMEVEPSQRTPGQSHTAEDIYTFGGSSKIALE